MINIGQRTGVQTTGTAFPSQSADWTRGYHALGQVIVHHKYDPFGNLTRRTGNASTRFAYRFSTKPRDAATGLYYYGYRWYDPYTGRWLNRDPIEEEGGVNLFGFVGNDGASRFDLYGLQSLPAEKEHPKPLRPNTMERPAGLSNSPSDGQLIENPKVMATGNCLGFALRDFHRVGNWDQSSWANALTHVPKGCRKVSCEGIDAGHTRCKDGECDVIVFIALSKAATPLFHAMGRKIGSQYGWSSTIFHYQERQRDGKQINGRTPMDKIVDPESHFKEYYPDLFQLNKREKLCFCCKRRDDKGQ